MKQTVDNWKQGWLLLAKWMHFTVLMMLWLIPGGMANYALKEQEITFVDGIGVNLQLLIPLIMHLIFLPLGFSSAQKQTGYLKTKEKTQNQ